MTDMTQALYEPITDSRPGDLANFNVEDFNPCDGSILVIVPPPETETEGGLYLPEVAQTPASVGKVVAVPSDQDCPVSLGDWVFFREGTGTPMTFEKREDILLIQYCEGPASEIIGYVTPN